MTLLYCQLPTLLYTLYILHHRYYTLTYTETCTVVYNIYTYIYMYMHIKSLFYFFSAKRKHFHAIHEFDDPTATYRSCHLYLLLFLNEIHLELQHVRGL